MSNWIAKFLVGIVIVAIVAALLVFKALLVTFMERQSVTIQTAFVIAVLIGVGVVIWCVRRK